MIEVKELVKIYGNHTAVDHISFSVESGLIYGFLGPNGAGKSTTMNMITGYIGATDGQIIVDGHDIFKEPEEARKCIGYLPEIPPLYMDMTIVEYLRFCAELKKVPKAERKKQIGQVIELCHLEAMQNRLIKNLSKGYKQRVGLAQAILGFPSVIILDEPTVGLDPKQIIEIRDLIKSLKQNHTVILSSHILAEVQEVCDRVLIISNGKLVAEGTPAELEAQLMGNTLTLTLLGTDTEGVVRVLNGIDGLNDITCSANANGEMVATCKYPNGTDPRAAISQACAAAGFAVLNMKNADVSLEQIFLQVTNSNDADDTDTVEIEIDDSDDETEIDLSVKEQSAFEKYEVVTNDEQISQEANTGIEIALEKEAELQANSPLNAEKED